MSRKATVTTQNNFTAGLITETHELKFPPNAASETFNVEITNTGTLKRRAGVDFEGSYQSSTNSATSTTIFTEFLWSNATGSGDSSLVVLQVGSTLHFYEVLESLVVSANKKSFTINLNDYKPVGSGLDPSDYQCSYTQGKGALIVANKAINPISVRFRDLTNTLEITPITIRVRDLYGVDDGLDLTERVTKSLTELKADIPYHYYNLLNQGWHTSDALTQWDSARSDMPSNSDTVSLYRASETDSFDANRVLSKSPGNTPAPKGHFILDALNFDRTQAMLDEGFTNAVVERPEILIGHNVGSNLGFAGESVSNAFNNITNPDPLFPEYFSHAGSLGKVGKDYGSSKKIIVRAFTFGRRTGGYTGIVGRTVTVTLKASNTDPNSGVTTPAVLGSITFDDTANESDARSISSNDTTTEWRYVWLEYSKLSEDPIYVAEVQFFSPSTTGSFLTTFERPTHVAFFAGRVFYAGVETAELNNNIYFSQILEDDLNIGDCYAYNDPTAEDFSSPLATDGGVIVIPNIAKITGLYTYQNSMVVIATNGVWLVQGGNSRGFTPTDYSVRSISSIGCNSPKSIVDFKGLPLWWGEDGINTINYEANYDSFSVVSLTNETIKTFFFEIPALSRNTCKGAFDVKQGRVQWVYASSSSLGVNQYDKMLSFNPMTKAFLTSTIARQTSVVGYPTIRGILYASNNARSTDSVIKFVTSYDDKITFSQLYQDIHVDWTAYATLKANTALLGNFDSYVVTGARLPADSIRDNQINYLHVFLAQHIDASVFVQVRNAFTTVVGAKRWNTPQKITGHPIDDRSVHHKRLKTRASSHAHQYKFYSEGSKPFEILGWTSTDSQNTNV